MNPGDQLLALQEIEERINDFDVSEGPLEFRLNVRNLLNVRIGGYSHLPLDQQLIKWAEGKGWNASIDSMEVSTIRIIKPQVLANTTTI